MCPEVFEILDFLTQPADSNDEHHDIQDHQSHCQNRNDHPEDQRSYNLHFPPESGNKNADASACAVLLLVFQRTNPQARTVFHETPSSRFIYRVP